MTVELLAHRGQWHDAREKNETSALERALTNGYGLETDLRDHDGEIVIAHDPPDSASGDLLTLSQLCQLYLDSAATSCLALNIKSDGLANGVRAVLEKSGIQNYFCFDMSVPDTLPYLSNSIPSFTRHSEFEQVPALYDDCVGVWIDAFNGRWYSEATIQQHFDRGKAVCLVSPELHGRRTEELWPMLRRFSDSCSRAERLLLCTDHPREFEACCQEPTHATD